MAVAIDFKNTTVDFAASGTGLGGRLTSLQADYNNFNLKTAVETLQASSGKTIASISATGNQMTITYTDATTDTITIPTAAFNWRGDFAAVSYAVNDLVVDSGTIYLVLIAHTGVLPFDAGRQIGGFDVYQKILDFPAIPIFTNANSTFTPALIHANSYIRCTNDTACTVSIPSNADVAFSLGTEFHFRDANSLTSGAGALTIEAANPTVTTINGPGGCTNVTATVHSTVTLKKIATDEWDMMGRLASI